MRSNKKSDNSSALGNKWVLHISYGNEEWIPPPLPEPSTYGAALSMVGFGLYLLRYKRGLKTGALITLAKAQVSPKSQRSSSAQTGVDL